jgi:hypothetical protein
MFKQVKRLIGQTQQDVKAVQRGDTDEALKRRIRPEAQKHAPGGSTGKKLIGKFFR